MNAIRYFSEGIEFNLKERTTTRNWLTSVIQEEFKVPGSINIIFCGDEYLADLNRIYLNHETFTDILTFSYDEKNQRISGDIYISIERITENSEKYKENFATELNRVMVHGILHLLGYKDKSRKEKLHMTSKENYYLERAEQINVSRGT